MNKIKSQKGFTLIEILVVIGIIAILATIVIIAINPARQFAQSRNTQRTANVQAILNAVGQRMVDNKGKFDGVGIDGKTCPTLPSSAVAIASPLATSPAAAQAIVTTATAGKIDFSCLTPTYISALPTDPSGPTSPDIGYSVVQDNSTGAGGRITVFSPTLETSALGQVNFVAITR